MSTHGSPYDRAGEDTGPDTAQRGPDSARSTPESTQPPEAVRKALQAHNYPLPDQEDDRRFCFGLIADLADVLVDHDYPPPEPMDFVQLMQVLFGFLYRPYG